MNLLIFVVLTLNIFSFNELIVSAISLFSFKENEDVDINIEHDLLHGRIQIGQIPFSTSSLERLNQYSEIIKNEKTVLKLFEQFKLTHGKSYVDEQNESMAFKIFKNNLLMVLNNNIRAVRGESSYVLALKSYSDLSLEEQLKQPVDHWSSVSSFNNLTQSPISSANSWVFDKYRQQNKVGPIQNQGSCGACVYFAAAACVESHWAIKGHPLQPLSPQQLNDCARDESHGNRGCQHGGGTFVPTFNYIKAHGLTSLSNYPYISKDANCIQAKVKQSVGHIKNWHSVLPHGNEGALREKVEHFGPVAVALHMSEGLMHYKSGVYNEECHGGRNHAVLVVGYGFDGHLNYWIVKNSWSVNYGEHGYFRLARDRGNLCDIAGDAVYVE